MSVLKLQTWMEIVFQVFVTAVFVRKLNICRVLYNANDTLSVKMTFWKWAKVLRFNSLSEMDICLKVFVGIVACSHKLKKKFPFFEGDIFSKVNFSQVWQSLENLLQIMIKQYITYWMCTLIYIRSSKTEPFTGS